MIMKENIKYAEILIKIGSLFAQCDGEVSEKETQFVKEFLIVLSTNKVIDITLENALRSVTAEPVSFDSVVQEMKNFLNKFTTVERVLIIETTKSFIQQLISSDGKIVPEEQSLFDRWNETIV